MRYDAEGLRAFAAACELHAADVCVRDHPAVPATTYQSTTDAVAALNVATGGAGDVLASRIRSTAADLSSAADRYSQTETQAADTLAASIDAETQ